MRRTVFLFLSLFYITISCYPNDIDDQYELYKTCKQSDKFVVAQQLMDLLIEQGYAPEDFAITPELSRAKIEQNVIAGMGNYAFRIEKYQESIDLMAILIQLAEQENDTVDIELAHYMSGFAYQRLGNMEKALFHSKKSYDICKKMGYTEQLSSVINMIANIYQTNNQDSIAIVLYKEGIELERELGRNAQLAIRLGNLSTSYLKQNKLNEALEAVTEALKLDREGTRKDKVAARLTQMADVYKAMKKDKQAKACLEEAYTYFVELKSNYGMAISLNMLGELELKQDNFKKADDYFTQAAKLAKENGNQYVYGKIAKNIYTVNRSTNPQKALYYFEQSTAINDSIFNRDTQKQISEFQIQYETAKKELEIVRQQAEINRHKVVRVFFIVILILISIVLLLFWWLLSIRNKKNRILAETNVTKDKFFGIISHDLKNPTIAQRDTLQLLSENVDKWDTATIQKFTSELLKSSNSQVELLYNLLNWGQVQTGRMVYQPAHIDLVAELRNDLILVKNLAGQKGIQFTSIMPEAVIVTGDRNMLTTVIRNLLTNAVKFTNALGTVTLSIVQDSSNRVKIDVSDTGAGMSKEQIDNLFDIAMIQTRRGTKGEDGNGLGLIVCHELIAKHGSKLEVESSLGVGSRFWFTIG